MVDPFDPELRQTVPGVAANVTGLPEVPPVALTVKGGSPAAPSDRAAKVIAWGTGTNSTAPISQAAPCGRGNPGPRWSTPPTGVAAQSAPAAASTTGLPTTSAWVSVGPPLSARTGSSTV